jgi:hypothetical protein
LEAVVAISGPDCDAEDEFSAGASFAAAGAMSVQIARIGEGRKQLLAGQHSWSLSTFGADFHRRRRIFRLLVAGVFHQV